jgi:hypothetical protein
MLSVERLVRSKLSGNKLYPVHWRNNGTKEKPSWELLDYSLSVTEMLNILGYKFEIGYDGKGKASVYYEIEGDVSSLRDAMQTSFTPGEKIISESIIGWKSGVYGELITSDNVFKDCEVIRKLLLYKHGRTPIIASVFNK